MSNEYKFVIVIKNIKDPNLVLSGGTQNKYKGAYKKIFDILDEDSVFVQTEVEEEKLKGNDFYLYFNSTPDVDKLNRLSKIPNVEILNDVFKNGGRTIAQTPAPKQDRVYGSDLNKSASSKNLSSAKLIKFDNKTLDVIKNKVLAHNSQHPDKKINLASAKAVVRRGMGAYSKSHRPTISGGKPNSRVAWGLARLNAFTYKIVNGKSESGKYSQDDDLIEELGFKVADYEKGGGMKKDIRCINCGWEWDKKDSELSDMYVCHKCGFDNTTFYTSIPFKKYLKGGEATGDCYIVSGRIVMGLEDKNIKYKGTPYLVHAEVKHSKLKGLRFGHAFIEDDENVYDFSNNREIIIPKQLYYFFGDIDQKNKKKYKKYTFRQAKEKMLSTGHYGCWDIETKYEVGGKLEDQNTVKAKKIAKQAEGKISHLECDGATRVLHYLFEKEDVNHIVKKGFVVLGNDEIPLHYWIELPDGNIVDYKSKMWLGSKAQQGIFEPNQKTQYAGKEVDLKVNKFIYDILTMSGGGFVEKSNPDYLKMFLGR